jgi:diaminopimelate decarboxylase
MQIDEEEMEQAEIEKRIRLPIYIYDSSDLRRKLNMLTFQPDKVVF